MVTIHRVQFSLTRKTTSNFSRLILPFGVICLVEVNVFTIRNFSFSSYYDKNMHEYFNQPYTFLRWDSKADTEYVADGASKRILGGYCLSIFHYNSHTSNSPTMRYSFDKAQMLIPFPSFQCVSRQLLVSGTVKLSSAVNPAAPQGR